MLRHSRRSSTKPRCSQREAERGEGRRRGSRQGQKAAQKADARAQKATAAEAAKAKRGWKPRCPEEAEMWLEWNKFEAAA